MRRSSPPPWPLHRLPRGTARRAATFALAVMAVLALVGLSGVRVARPGPGYVGVVRNGGPFDSRETQAQYAAVSSARARQARYESGRSELLGRAHNDSPAPARIDAIKAAPKGTTVIIGSGHQSPQLLLGK